MVLLQLKVYKVQNFLADLLTLPVYAGSLFGEGTFRALFLVISLFKGVIQLLDGFWVVILFTRGLLSLFYVFFVSHQLSLEL